MCKTTVTHKVNGSHKHLWILQTVQCRWPQFKWRFSPLNKLHDSTCMLETITGYSVKFVSGWISASGVDDIQVNHNIWSRSDVCKFRMRKNFTTQFMNRQLSVLRKRKGSFVFLKITLQFTATWQQLFIKIIHNELNKENLHFIIVCGVLGILTSV